MLINYYIVSKNKIEDCLTIERLKIVHDKNREFDIIVNDLVNVYTNNSSNRIGVEISNELPNHQEILNTVQNILKETL